jgi:hypothetical protein
MLHESEELNTTSPIIPFKIVLQVELSTSFATSSMAMTGPQVYAFIAVAKETKNKTSFTTTLKLGGAQA